MKSMGLNIWRHLNGRRWEGEISRGRLFVPGIEICGFLLLVVFISQWTSFHFALNNTSDEFAYLSNARYLAGKDVYEMTKFYMSYYGFGYSFFLVY